MKNVSGKMLVFGFVGALVATGAGVALLLDIMQKKVDTRQYPMMNFQVSDEQVDPAVWGKNFPSHYDGYLSTATSDQATTYGGSLPYSKLIRFPQLTRLWAGYPFSADFNEERGHYYSQIDQMETKRNDKAWLNSHGFPKFQGQPGACMNCHSGWAPALIREMGWESFNSTPYVEITKKLAKDHGDGIHGAQLGSTCADCHHPEDMSLRVTRPAYINAMVKRGYAADEKSGIKGTRQEFRSHVCQQCHVEYYFKGPSKELTFPWSMWPKDQPLGIEMIELYYDIQRKDPQAPFPSDWTHKESGAPMLKMQHPEAELASSGIHARSGVACTDCHMPYKREGALKVTDHGIRSPLTMVSRACQNCHPMKESEILARVQTIQTSTSKTLRRAESAVLALVDDIVAAQKGIQSSPRYTSAASQEAKDALQNSILAEAREAHRRASMRWDFIASENSTGFHSPQEAGRVLAQSIDIARQGQLSLVQTLTKEGISVTGPTRNGATPAPGAPIPEHKAPVGQVPPQWMTTADGAARD